MKPIGDDKSRGAALFVVLMFLVVVTNLALVALRSSASEVRAAGLFVDEARADELGRSIVPLTRYFISADFGTRARGGSFTTEFDVGKVRIDYLSETARVDVNRSPADLLTAVLLAAGLDQDRIESIAGKIAQRRSAQTPVRYESPFEIAADWVLSDDEAQKIIPLLTTVNQQGMIDPLLADPVILSALLERSDSRVSQFEEARKIGLPNEEMALSYFTEPAKNWIKFGTAGTEGPVRASAAVTTRRGLRRSFEAVFDPRGEGDNAKIYYWRPLD